MDKLKTKKGSRTVEEMNNAVDECRVIFIKKMEDYGTSWHIMRPSSLTDQIFIKAKRIRYIEENGEENTLIKEGIRPEFIGIVNYGAMALIQLERRDYEKSLSKDEALKLYDRMINDSVSLMYNKNHDYNEAWRQMRVSSFTDIILQKLYRTREIENNNGKTIISEGIDANYMDIINYALFALIKLKNE